MAAHPRGHQGRRRSRHRRMKEEKRAKESVIICTSFRPGGKRGVVLLPSGIDDLKQKTSVSGDREGIQTDRHIRVHPAGTAGLPSMNSQYFHSVSATARTSVQLILLTPSCGCSIPFSIPCERQEPLPEVSPRVIRPLRIFSVWFPGEQACPPNRPVSVRFLSLELPPRSFEAQKRTGTTHRNSLRATPRYFH